MPEKVDEQSTKPTSTEQQNEEAQNVAEEQKSQDQSANENGAEKQDGAEEVKEVAHEEEGESPTTEAPKRRGRKPKQSQDVPDTKKPKKETKTPERISSRVRNRSTGEKLPDFKDMKDLPSPTRRKSKSNAKEDEKPATADGEQVEATA